MCIVELFYRQEVHMKVVKAENVKTISYGNKMPQKRTYRAMGEYFSEGHDKVSAKFYNALDRQVRYRFHSQKAKMVQQKMIDYSEEIEEGLFSSLRFVKYYKKQFGYSMKHAKESLLAFYYGIIS